MKLPKLMPLKKKIFCAIKTSKRLVTSLQPWTLQEICVVLLQGLLHSQGTESSPLAVNTIGEAGINQEKDTWRDHFTTLFPSRTLHLHSSTAIVLSEIGKQIAVIAFHAFYFHGFRGISRIFFHQYRLRLHLISRFRCPAGWLVD